MKKTSLHYFRNMLLIFCTMFSTQLFAQVDYSIGTGTTGNTGTSYPCPLQDYYEGNRAQFLYKASELTAAGASSGTITTIKWNVTALNATGSIENYTIKIGTTSVTTLSATTYEPGTATVYGPINYQPIVGNNVFNLSVPLVWNGSDNIIVEVCSGDASNASGPSQYTNNPTVPWTTGLSFNGSHYYFNDNEGNLCGTTSTATFGATFTTRPNITFSISPSTSCSGATTAGLPSSSSGMVCTGQSFTLSSTGFTVGAGVSYQWQSSQPGANSFTNIPAATGASYTTTQTQPTDYRFIVSCTNPGGGSDTSSPVFVGQNSFLSCYCTSAATSTDYTDVSNVTLNGVSNASTCTTTGDPATSTQSKYSDYTTVVPAISMGQGDVVPFSITDIDCGTFGGNQSGVAMFIDYNQDGLFTGTGEKVFASGNYGNPTTYSGSFIVPLSAAVGTTRMRVISLGYTNGTSITPCGTYYGGETEDYFVNITQAVACTGSPLAGAVSSNDSTVCTGQSFTLSSSGFTSGSGITFQWYAAVGGGSPTPISGATDPIYTVVSQSQTTDYFLEITCNNPGGGTTNSNILSITQNSFLNCYCVSAATSTQYSDISNVTVNGVSNASTCTTTGDPATSIQSRYSDYTTVVTAINIGQGDVVPFSVTDFDCPGFGDQSGVAMFIDYNQDGLFSGTGEKVFASGAYGNATTYTGTFLVPLSATVGTTRMRVISEGYTNGTSITPCGTYYGGETEDYFVNITQAGNCAGTPTAGAVSSNDSTVCTAQAFTLSSSGFTSGSGITFQWYSSTGGGSPVAISGATDPIYTVTSQSQTTDYFLEITCNNPGGGVANSNVLTITQNLFNLCYCSSAASFSGDEEIYSFTLNGANSNTFSSTLPANICTTNAPGPGSIIHQYGNYQSLGSLTSVLQGQTYSFTVQEDECNGPTYYDFGTAIWVDWNQDGVYDNATEKVFVEAATAQGPRNVVGTILVPINAVVGTTGLRVQVQEGGSGTGLLACGTYNYGETEDYLITVLQTVACSGTPTAGTATPSATTVCINQSFTINTSGTTAAAGISYQWYSGPAGTTPLTAINGATNQSYNVTSQSASTDYYLEVTCSNPGGGTAVTNTVTVTQNSFFSCYCNTGLGGANYAWIDSVQILTTTLNNGPTGLGGVAGNYYTAYPATGNTTASLSQGTTYTIHTVYGTSSTNSASAIASLWIDYNQDGVFSASEWVQLGTTDSSHTQTFMVPSNALTGQTGLRIRSRGTGNPNGATDACSNFGSGETEDYVVTIVAGTGCLAPAGLAATNVAATSATLSWSAVTGAVGYEYTIDQNIASPIVAGTPTSTTTVNATNLTATTTYYLHVRTDCGSGSFSPWSTLMFSTTIANDNAIGAVALVVNAGCTGSPYTSVGSTQSTNEPYTSCEGTAGYHTVWYKFIAPASGAVKVSNDYTGGTLGDTRMAVFAATDSSNYSTFSILGCDDDNGVASGTKSIVYLTSLTPGNTYYVVVDNYSNSAGGTFCLTVDGLTSAMLSSTGNCTGVQFNGTINAAYTGWISLVDNSGNLMANVRQTAATAATSYNGSVTVNTGAVRNDGAPVPTNYLDRNYLISATGVTSADLQLFFTDAELTALGVPLSNLNVTRQTGSTCQANFAAANGTGTLLTQTGNGTSGTANWINVTTPGFSNFYINPGNNPLEITLGDVAATNEGNRNRIDWNSLTEHSGDAFEIERSADGRSFSYIGKVEAEGTANTYSFFDVSPINGINYYRLKLVNKGSTNYTYSKVVNATVKGTNGFSVIAYPNPVNENTVKVEVRGLISGEATILVTDVTGKVVRTVTTTATSTSIDLNGLSNGIYLIKYSDNDHSENIKVTKQ